MSWKPVSWVGSSFLVALFLIGFWGWYIYSQRLSLEENNWDELSHTASDLNTTFSSLTSTADRYFRGFKEEVVKKPENQKDSTEDKLHEKASQFAKRNPYIRDRSAEEFKKRLISEGKATQANGFNTPSEGARLLDPRKLQVPCWFFDPKRRAPSAKILEFNVNPETIFADAVISEAFDYLFIADQNGRVLFEMEHGTMGQRKEQKGWLERRAQEDSSQRQSAVSIVQLCKLAEVGAKELEPSTLAAASGSRTIRLGNRTYQLYTRPLAITSFQKEKVAGSVETTWIVGGLVDPRHLWREALTISPQSTLLLFLLFGIAVAAQPFVKLFLLTRTERFRFLDACLLLPSATFLLLSAIILLLSGGTYWHRRSLASDRLAALAQHVEDNLTSEFREMRDQLVQYDQNLVKSFRKLGRLPEEKDLLNLLDNTQARPTEPPSYQDFYQLSWIDSCGRPFLKGSIYDYNIPGVNVSSRPYFTEARDNHLWSFTEKGGNPFFVQSSRSIVTGELFTALSLRSELKRSEFENDCQKTKNTPLTEKDKLVVAMISVRPVSMERPVLPLGHSFAVIRPDGQVLYHSDRRRSLKENLHEELTDPERLYAAIQARSPQHFSTTYARRPTEVFIQPFRSIPEAGWFVVAFRDERWLETLASEALLRAMSWSLVPMGAPLLLFAGLVGAGRKCLQHLWPDRRKKTFYRAITVISAGLLVLGLSGVAILNGGSLLAWSVGFTFPVVLLIAMTHLAWIRISAHSGTLDEGFITAKLRAPRSVHSGKHERPSYRTWYLLALGTFWASVTVVPGVGVSRYAWETEQAKLNWAEQDHVVSHSHHWRAEEKDRTNGLKIADPADYLKKRIRYLDRYYLAFGASAPLVSPADSGGSLGSVPWWDRLLDRYLPLYNEPVQRLRYALPAQFDTPLPFSAAGLAFGWPGFLGAASIFVVAWGWLHYKARHLLWSDLAESRWSEVKPRSGGPFEFLLTPSDREKKSILAKMLEKAAAATAGAGAQQSPSAAGVGSSGQPKLVMVDDFEQLMLEQDRRLEKLQELERTDVTEGGRAVILCHKDPSHLFSVAEGTDDDLMKIPADMPILEKERWLRVLEPFVLHVTAVNGAGASPEPSPESQVRTAGGFARRTREAEPHNQQAYFGSLWRYCSRPEKLTLVQVAQEGFANPHQGTAVGSMVKKGLLAFRPNLTLMSREFETFVLQKASSSDVRNWEQTQGSFGWRQMRWIFALILLGALIFLAGTQESWIKGVTAMVAGVATALELISRMLGSVKQSRQALT